MKPRISIITATLFALASCASAQFLFTTPGNGVSIRARLFYPDGRPCVSCPLQWKLLPHNQPDATVGFHYHSVTGAPLGTFTHTDTATDSNGYGNASWTSELQLDEEINPTGYALNYNINVCSPVATNYCQLVTVRTLYSGLTALTASTGWYKTTDASHNSQQYAATLFFSQEIALIASKYHSSNASKSFMVVRVSLPIGGIYDGQLNRTNWQNHYATSYGGEDHMYGDEADISVSGMTTVDVSKLQTAVTSTLEQDGVHKCQMWPGTNFLIHIYCGEIPE